MIFILIGVAGYRRRADTGSNAAIVVLAIGLTAIVLGFFAVDTLQNAPETFSAIIAIAALAVFLDALWTRARDRRERGGTAQPSPS